MNISNMANQVQTGVTRAADTLREAILRGELAPGVQLRQAELAGQLGLSRVPVREALQVLETEGLLLHRPNSGYYVRRLSAEELSQVYVMLDLLEEVVLTNITGVPPEQLDRLVAINAELEVAFSRNAVHDRMELNREFHVGILRLGQQPIILQEIQRLWTMSESYRILHLHDHDSHTETLQQHRLMVEAIKTGDSQTLVKLAKMHRQVSKTSVLRILAAQSGFQRPEQVKGWRPEPGVNGRGAVPVSW